MNQTNYPQRLKRSESFLGIHFDFHAGEDNQEIGKYTTKEMLGNIIEKVKPDYIQCDCKGHRGFSSYLTKVGYPAPGIKVDALKLWREVTAKAGVALFMHYSGVWDTEALKHHPSWARIDEKGKRDKNNTSCFGPYVDKLLIPQLKELSDIYEVDGVWIDGDCWATSQDYGKKVVEGFIEKTGIVEIPRKPDDPYFYEYTEYCREGFKNYVRHYVEELHKHNPDFQVASNWAFTSFMPEAVSANVDFISGDYSLQNSLNAARLEGRCMAKQGKPWDLMAWSFSSKFGEDCFSTKSVPQLKQEASVVLALGGGFQAYFTQKKNGSINSWQMNLMAEVAKFCRERQNSCHKAKTVPQVALFYSGADFYKRNPRAYGNWGSLLLAPMEGALRALLESQYSVDIVMEHQISGHFKDYPIVIIPEWKYIKPELKMEMLKYTKEGGNLLIIGSETAAGFKEELGINYIGEITQEAPNWIEHRGWLAGMKTRTQNVEIKSTAKGFGRIFKENDNIGESTPAASVADYGKGKIAAIYFNFGERYLHGATSTARDFLGDLVKILFPKPMVEVKGSHYVDVSVNKVRDKLAISLINTSGPHANNDIYVFDEIPKIGPLEITVRTGEKPSRVTREPVGSEVEFDFVDGEIKLSIPSLEIYDLIMVEF